MRWKLVQDWQTGGWRLNGIGTGDSVARDTVLMLEPEFVIDEALLGAHLAGARQVHAWVEGEVVDGGLPTSVRGVGAVIEYRPRRDAKIERAQQFAFRWASTGEPVLPGEVSAVWAASSGVLYGYRVGGEW